MTCSMFMYRPRYLESVNVMRVLDSFQLLNKSSDSKIEYFFLGTNVFINVCFKLHVPLNQIYLSSVYLIFVLFWQPLTSMDVTSGVTRHGLLWTILNGCGVIRNTSAFIMSTSQIQTDHEYPSRLRNTSHLLSKLTGFWDQRTSQIIPWQHSRLYRNLNLLRSMLENRVALRP